MEPLILPMMMFGSYMDYEREKDPKDPTGKKYIIKKKLNDKGKLVPAKKKITHIESRGDMGFYPSVNHIYQNTGKGGKKLTKAAEQLLEKWQGLAMGWAIRNNWVITDKEKVVLELYAYFPDKQVRDTHNVLKLMMDALEKVIYKNDNYALPRIMDFEYLEKGSEVKPYFELRIYKKSDEIDLEDVRKEYEQGRTAS